MRQHAQQLFFGLGIIVLGVSQAVTSSLKGTDGLLESLLVGFTDTHDLANRAHLCAQLVLYTLEFFKCPAGKLDDDVISVGNVFVQGTVFSTFDVL